MAYTTIRRLEELHVLEGDDAPTTDSTKRECILTVQTYSAGSAYGPGPHIGEAKIDVTWVNKDEHKFNVHAHN
jgi:hypothetical protein